MRIPRRKRATPAPPSAGGPLDVDVSGTAYGAVVTIAGELDLATVPKVREAFGSEALTHASVGVRRGRSGTVARHEHEHGCRLR